MDDGARLPRRATVGADDHDNIPAIARYIRALELWDGYAATSVHHPPQNEHVLESRLAD